MHVALDSLPTYLITASLCLCPLQSGEASIGASPTFRRG